LQNIPVILLSARAGEESRIEGLDAGADDYLVKPFSARELVARVGAMLERERLHREARATLEAASRQKDEFLAMLAHELRNPLAAIRNAGELLSRTQSTNSRPQAGIDVIRRQVAQLTRLVDDLLDVSRITQARIELKRRPLELASVIAQAVETVEPLLREKQHKLSITSTSGYQPVCVDGDSARLVQCVVNVLTNAAKYTDPGGEIRVQTRSEDSSAVIEISDTGVGISPELLPRIFDLFVQSDRTLDRSLGGLGIGLSVVKRLIEMHGGQVTGRSEGLGRGSTFEIRLPLIEPPNTASSEIAPFKAAPRRVLIVDDNADSANSLAALLQLDMHEAEAVFTAHAALSLAVAFKPDIVLLDIGLPDMDGYEVARRLRALPGLHAVRLVALTGYGQAEDRQRAREAGFDDHLVKPIDFMALERTLAGISGGEGKGEQTL
jgi:signal transduction histidine kinase/ActR/RegA family two-component response regulator